MFACGCKTECSLSFYNSLRGPPKLSMLRQTKHNRSQASRCRKSGAMHVAVPLLCSSLQDEAVAVKIRMQAWTLLLSSSLMMSCAFPSRHLIAIIMPWWGHLGHSLPVLTTTSFTDLDTFGSMMGRRRIIRHKNDVDLDPSPLFLSYDALYLLVKWESLLTASGEALPENNPSIILTPSWVHIWP